MITRLQFACGLIAAGVGSGAHGDFYFGTIAFGGDWPGLIGFPLVPVDGSIIAMGSTDPRVHKEANAIFGGADGWGTTVGGVQDEAPAGVAGDPTPGSFSVDNPYTIIPVSGLDAAGDDFFAGFYGGNEDNPDIAGVIIAEDNDAWVARIRVTEGATLRTSGPVVVGIKGFGDSEHSDLHINEYGVVGASGNGDNRTDHANYWIEYREIPNLFTDGSVVFDVFVMGDSTGTVPPPPPPPPPPPGGGEDPPPGPGPASFMPDFNRDGVPNMGDVRYLLLSYGDCTAWNCDMDANRDGVIDSEDASAWLDVFQSQQYFDKAGRRAIKQAKKSGKKVGKANASADKKSIQLVEAESQLEIETNTKKRRKLAKKIVKLRNAIDRLLNRIEETVESVADIS